MKFNLLALETSTEACSAAIISQGKCVHAYELTQRAHTQLILPMIADLLAQTHLSMVDITHLAVGKGPGSFTGVRIGVGVAQGLAFGLNKPVYGISTLEALALQAYHQLGEPEDVHIIPLLDARMQEVYAAIYNVVQGVLHLGQNEQVCTPDKIFAEVAKLSGKIIAIGSGWDQYLPAFEAQFPTKKLSLLPVNEEISPANNAAQGCFMAGCYPRAQEIALLAQQQWQQGVAGINALSCQPTYLRDNVAQKPAALIK